MSFILIIKGIMIIMPQRIYSNELPFNKNVLVKGWVGKIRDLGGLKFFILRDREGVIQITAKKGSVKDNIINTISGLNREDCVEVIGKVKESKQAPGGKEIIPEEVKVVSRSDSPLPIETSDKIQTGLDKRFDYRFIDLRNPKIHSIFRVRDTTLTLMREFFESNGFIEVHTPVIQAAGAEGGATLFPLI